MLFRSDEDAVSSVTPIIKPEEDAELQAMSEEPDAGDGSEQLSLVASDKKTSKADDLPPDDDEPLEEL